MYKASLLLATISLLLYQCQVPKEQNPEELKQSIMEVEKQFNDLAAEKSVKEAFLQFAADGAVIVRNNKVYKGKEAIAQYFDNVTIKDYQLSWRPDFIDVSTSGDMAYTYGQYTFSATDSTGQELSSTGIFHTVWKKQADRGWKFVYD